MSIRGEEDVYTDTPEDAYPGARHRSRPGTAAEDEVYERVAGPSGQPVSAKSANKPFLKSKAKREAHQARQRADAARRANAPSSTTSTILTRLIILLFFIPLLSQFTTGSWTFNTSAYLAPRLRRFWQFTPLNPFRTPLREFTELQLARYDGSDPWGPLYLAIDGDVYDVTANRRVYGKGGSYNFMTGNDASRSFVTGCFETHRTHDLRGLTDEQLKSLDHWKSFFANHAKYRLIGKVLHAPIEPSSPIPPPCQQEGEESSDTGPHGPKAADAPDPSGSGSGGARATGEL